MSINKRIASDSVKTALVTFFMQGAAFAVSIIVAAYFGATLRTDAYFFALAVPALFTAALFGALKAVFVPVYTSHVKSHPDQERDVLGAVYTTVLVLSLIAAALLWLAAPWLMPWVAGGLNGEGQQLATVLARELIPLVVLTSLIGLMGAVYNAHHRFVLPIIAPLLRTVVLLAFILFGRERLGIHALSYGTVVGEFGHFLVLAIALRWRGMYVGFRSWKHEVVRKMAKLSVPPITGNLILEFNPLVDKIMIASTAVGSVTALNIAAKWNDIPLMLLSSGGFMSVILAHWSTLKADTDMKQVTRSLEQTLSMVTFILVPFLVAFFVLRVPIISMFYRHKEFSAESVQHVATLWGILLWGVLPLLWGRVLVRVYHVMQDTKTPFWFGISRTGLNVVFNFWFKALFGLAGIALSTTVTSAFLTGVNFLVLKKRVRELRLGVLSLSFSKIAVCALPAGWVISFLYPLVLSGISSAGVDIETIQIVGAMGVSSFIGLLAYVVLALLFKIDDVKSVFALVSTK